MKKALVAAAISFLLVNIFWLVWFYIVGSLPTVDEFLWHTTMVDGEKIRTVWTNPFALPRIPFDGAVVGFISMIVVLVNNNWKNADDLLFGLLVGLLVGLFVGLFFGLFFGLLVGLLVGLLFGLLAGLGWTIGYSFWATMVFGASIGFGSFLLILFASCAIPAMYLLAKNQK